MQIKDGIIAAFVLVDFMIGVQADDEIISHLLRLFQEIDVTHVEHVKSADRVHDFVTRGGFFTLGELQKEYKTE